MEMSQGNSLQNYLIQTKHLSSKNGEQEGTTVFVWGLEPGGGYKKRVQKGECEANIMYSCMKIEK
jgi:hypothetical protein